MKIVFICRLYSGFEDSLRAATWQPIGAPTIARLIERLDSDPETDMDLVFTAKDFGSSWNLNKDIQINVRGLDTSIRVLASTSGIPTVFGRLRHKLADLRQFVILMGHVLRDRPDLVYFDRVNLLPAAILARLTSIPVVWRVMGVLESMHNLAESRGWRAKLTRFLWRSPFKAVICTRDGSEGGTWMARNLAKNTQQILLVNGIAPEPSPESIVLPVDQYRNILFAGRIEKLKGLDVLLDAMTLLRQRSALPVRIVMAGYGNDAEWMQQQVRTRNLEDHFHFTGAMSGRQMAGLRRDIDIALACGTHGNLPNTVLEALMDGMCQILPAANKAQGRDIDVNSFLPADVALRYGLQNDVEGLASTLEKVYNAPELVAGYKAAAAAFAKTDLPSWDDRVRQEFNLLRELSAKPTNARSCVQKPEK